MLGESFKSPVTAEAIGLAAWVCVEETGVSYPRGPGGRDCAACEEDGTQGYERPAATCVSRVCKVPRRLGAGREFPKDETSP